MLTKKGHTLFNYTSFNKDHITVNLTNQPVHKQIINNMSFM